MALTTGEQTRTWVPDWPCSVAQVLRPQRRGAGDPTQREDDAGRTWRAMRTPTGPASLCVQARPSSGDVHARAWGPGAEWALDRCPGCSVPTTTRPASTPIHPLVADAWRRRPHGASAAPAW